MLKFAGDALIVMFAAEDGDSLTKATRRYTHLRSTLCRDASSVHFVFRSNFAHTIESAAHSVPYTGLHNALSRFRATTASTPRQRWTLR